MRNFNEILTTSDDVFDKAYEILNSLNNIRILINFTKNFVFLMNNFDFTENILTNYCYEQQDA